MRHWMFLTHPDNWQKCLEHGLFGYDEEYAYTVERYIQPGDRAIIYLAQRSAIWGVVEITEVLLNQTEPIGWLKKGWEARKGARIEGTFPARVRFRPLCRVEPPRVIAGNGNEWRNQLEYITDKKRWNVFVQIALSRVPGADVDTVMRWARGSAHGKGMTIMPHAGWLSNEPMNLTVALGAQRLSAKRYFDHEHEETQMRARAAASFVALLVVVAAVTVRGLWRTNVDALEIVPHGRMSAARAGHQATLLPMVPVSLGPIPEPNNWVVMNCGTEANPDWCGCSIVEETRDYIYVGCFGFASGKIYGFIFFRN